MFTLSAHLTARFLETFVLVSSSLSVKHTAEFICLQVVRPHAPLIKFPNRLDIAKPNGEYALYYEGNHVGVYLITYFSLLVKLFPLQPRRH